MQRVSFSITEWTNDLASRLDWVVSPSHKLTEWPVWNFCLVVQQLAWRFNFFACFTRVHCLVACQSRVPTSLHILEYFFTVSHTLSLHNSHLNIGFLSAEIQANWHGIKSTKWLIKFNLTNKKIHLVWIELKDGYKCNCTNWLNVQIMCKTLWMFRPPKL